MLYVNERLAIVKSILECCSILVRGLVAFDVSAR